MKAARPGAGPVPRHPRIQALDVGVETIARWRVDDEQHLPKDKKAPPVFLPETRALDEILHRPSLDERLPNLLKPERLDPDLLRPARVSDIRRSLAQRFRDLEQSAAGEVRRTAFAAAATVLEEDIVLDDEVRTALALLLRG
ncbi:hypothetical protein [Aquibium microcysteis]|uniref:type III secretion apparatus assembly protein SctX n=1 Tax=Aquibium microcysteis TaxID=675281 RepID=UPI00165D1E5A|nr:hypothetical protein [Aquibium microcysteis]